MTVVEVKGIEFFIEAGEQYLQMNDVQGEDLATIWDEVVAKYPGFEATFCYRDMPSPLDVLDGIGARLLEDCIRLDVTPESFTPYGGFEISPLDKEDFEQFAAIHDAAFPEDDDMYWTSRRIWDAWDIFRIFVHKTAGEITGYVLLCVGMRDKALSEVFALWGESSPLKSALLSAAATAAFELGKELMINMVDRGDTTAMAEALAVGFKEVGYYRGYCVDIPSNIPS